MSHTTPVRMCIGCRERAAKSNLLRVVAEFAAGSESALIVVPDVRAKRAGRGASLHPTLACLDLAERRRAFPRALKLEGPLDTSVLREWITAYEQSIDNSSGRSSPEALAVEPDRK
jgi:predicted RNA-binding protein YlxR (DUF448 family)